MTIYFLADISMRIGALGVTAVMVSEHFFRDMHIMELPPESRGFDLFRRGTNMLNTVSIRSCVMGPFLRAAGRGVDLYQQVANKYMKTDVPTLETSKECQEELDLSSQKASALEKERKEIQSKEKAICSFLKLAQTLSKKECTFLDELKRIALRSALAIDQIDSVSHHAIFTLSGEKIETIVRTVMEILDNEQLEAYLREISNLEATQRQILSNTPCQDEDIANLSVPLPLQQIVQTLSTQTQKLYAIVQREREGMVPFEEALQQIKALLNNQ